MNQLRCLLVVGNGQDTWPAVTAWWHLKARPVKFIRLYGNSCGDQDQVVLSPITCAGIEPVPILIT
jgi:hypothetical protein